MVYSISREVFFKDTAIESYECRDIINILIVIIYWTTYSKSQCENS